jgi:(p)ppGpp synthase/HD superfamily hydrolase
MIYTEMTKKALKLCFAAHKDQTDKSGMPYVFHPFHLAEQMPDEDTTIVALLHDVIEDTPYTLDDLRAMGFNEQVLDALALMTHDKRIPYMDYVAKIKGNKIARPVKLADLKHNSDLSRLNNVDEKAMKRIEKYRQAIALLSEPDPGCQI